MWFLQNAGAWNFSIYIHSAPGFLFDKSTTRSHFFYGRHLLNSIQVVIHLASSFFVAKKMK